MNNKSKSSKVVMTLIVTSVLAACGEKVVEKQPIINNSAATQTQAQAKDTSLVLAGLEGTWSATKIEYIDAKDKKTIVDLKVADESGVISSGFYQAPAESISEIINLNQFQAALSFKSNNEVTMLSSSKSFANGVEQRSMIYTSKLKLVKIGNEVILSGAPLAGVPPEEGVIANFSIYEKNANAYRSEQGGSVLQLSEDGKTLKSIARYPMQIKLSDVEKKVTSDESFTVIRIVYFTKTDKIKM